jgi:hypothetical protein
VLSKGDKSTRIILFSKKSAGKLTLCVSCSPTTGYGSLLPGLIFPLARWSEQAIPVQYIIGMPFAQVFADLYAVIAWMFETIRCRVDPKEAWVGGLLFFLEATSHAILGRPKAVSG